MPIPVVSRIDPRDLDINKAVGLALPFNAKGVFKTTKSTQDQVKSNLINLLLTYKGERVMNPEFGADLPKLLFDPITPKTYTNIQNQIATNVGIFIPEITLTDITITPDADRNILYVSVSYEMKISKTPGKIIIDFSTLR